MFKDAYLHRVCQAIDFMIADALYYANPVYKFDENILKPEEYIKFTDGLLEQIEYSSNPELK